MSEIRKLTKNTKLFYTIRDLDYGEVLAMHSVVKNWHDNRRRSRGARKGRMATHLPLDPIERAKVIAYNESLPNIDDNLPFDREMVYEIPSDKPVRIKPTPKHSTLIKKYEFFLHNLISREQASDDRVAYLNSKVLEAVFDKDYLIIKLTLIRLGIITTDDWYEEGVKSFGFMISPAYRSRICVEQKATFYPKQEYVETLARHLKQQDESDSKQARKNLTDVFYDSYLSSLQQLRLTEQEHALSFINTHFKSESASKYYYLYIIEQYHKHNYKIQVPNTIDNRIYHILTSTPRNLKYFLNIRFSLDIHNSHPLLLSSLIYDHYQVPIEYRKNISLCIREILYPSYNVYNVRVKLYNKLLDRGINYSNIKQIPIDVIKYLYLVSMGKFWDVVIPTLNESDGKQYGIIRQDVKVIMFAQVFYGKQLSSRGQEYAKVFAKQFPNVYSIILSFKRGLAKEDRTQLTHKLMALESRLFREALRRLYDRDYRVVSIHDAIVVLDVKENDFCTPDVVKDVLTEVYGELGLVPDCSVDEYGKDEMMSFMERESFLRERGDAYIEELRASAEDPDIKRLLDDYDRGKSEIILTPNKQDVMLHLRDTKDLMYR